MSRGGDPLKVHRPVFEQVFNSRLPARRRRQQEDSIMNMHVKPNRHIASRTVSEKSATRRQAETKITYPFPSLPFIVDGLPHENRRLPRNYWVSDATGDYAEEVKRGANRAVQMMLHIAKVEDANALPIFSQVIQAMIEDGKVTGDTVGFAWTLAEAFRGLLHAQPGFIDDVASGS